MKRTHAYYVLTAFFLGYSPLSASWADAWTPDWGEMWNSVQRVSQTPESPATGTVPPVTPALRSMLPFTPAADWTLEEGQKTNSTAADLCSTHLCPTETSTWAQLEELSLNDLISTLVVTTNATVTANPAYVRELINCMIIRSNFHRMTFRTLYPEIRVIGRTTAHEIGE